MLRKLPHWTSLLAVLAAALFLAGCDEQKPPAPVSAPKPAARIVVPGFVQGQWQAVRIAVFDKGEQREDTYVVNLGDEFRIPGTRVHFKVDNYLPAFVIDNKTLTSLSNEPTNPAVQISIFEGDKLVHQDWLFQRFPEAHTFQHPRYNFTLVGAMKKKG